MQIITRTSPCLILLAALVLTGCSGQHYSIYMEPVDGGLKRQISVGEGVKPESDAPPNGEGQETSEGPDRPPTGVFAEELKRIQAAYKEPAQFDGEYYTFTQIFHDNTPPDIGGAGEYRQFTSAFGSVSIYAERFRGNDDLVQSIEARKAAIDQIVNLLMGWITEEINDLPTQQRVTLLLDKKVRGDLKNLALISWTNDATVNARSPKQVEVSIRAMQFLIERNYLTLADIPTIQRLNVQESDTDRARFAAFLHRIVVRKLNLEEGAVPPSLDFLKDANHLETSLRKYLRNREEYQLLLAEWRAKKDKQPDETPPDPLEVLALLLVQGFNVEYSPTDTITVQLATGVEPVESNGEWDAKEQHVAWVRELRGSLPVILYAKWSTPNEAAQQKRFGRTILAGAPLADYTLWYQGLSPDQATEWDRFVATLNPLTWQDQLNDFQFQGDDHLATPAKEAFATAMQRS